MKDIVRLVLMIISIATFILLFVKDFGGTVNLLIQYSIAGVIFFIIIMFIFGVIRLIYPLKPYNYTLELFKVDLFKYSDITDDQIIGCTQSEIDEIMKSQNVIFLPKVYKEFLQLFGKLTVQHPSIEGLCYPENLNNLKVVYANGNNPNQLLEEDVLIISIIREVESKQFLYIHLNENLDNPPIYINCVESLDVKSGKILFNSFTEYLNDWVESIKY